MKRIKQPDKKIKIYYTSTAFLKIVELVMAHKDEIGWNMVIKPIEDGYKVYDVVVYPQKASSGYIDVDVGRYAVWKASLPEDIESNLYGQGHSHVSMHVIPSPRDKKQQLDEVESKGSGFFFFQIWNKKMESNSFFYDIDNDLMYENNEIEIIVEDSEFVSNSRKMLVTSYYRAKNEEYFQDNIDEEDEQYWYEGQYFKGGVV